MKFGIARRLALLLALTGVLASGFTGYYAYSTSRDLLVQAAEQRLLTATQVLVRQLLVALDNTGRDVRLVAGHPRALLALTARDAGVRADAEADLDALFARMLNTHPEYFQMRLISAADHGLERVRLDRDAAGLIRVAGDDLQEKGHYPYAFDTLRLPAGSVYVSTPVINHERGAHAGQDKPSLQLAAPIYGGDKQPLGLIVISVDLDNIFGQLAADLPPGIELILTNRQGDFLVHPDHAQAFAFDRGRRALVQEQFPATTALVDGLAKHVVTTARLDPRDGGEVVAAFVKQHLPAPQPDRFFVLGLAQPLAAVLAASDAVGAATLRIVLGFSALSVLLALLLARAVTRPLNQVVHAVQRFSAGHAQALLPTERGDEIGVLARSVGDMQQQIQAQIATLHAKQSELDHLASHDSLTGLPNRRVFLDRMEHALLHVRRDGGQMALLFIDLDHFKEINDRLGHAAGDELLRIVAQRMCRAVREADTVARIGGDEFLILLDATSADVVVDLVAQKLLDVLAPPVPYGDEMLRIEASIGIGCYPQDGATVTEVIAAADRAMYRAKEEGRNRYCFADTAPEATRIGE